MSRADQNSEFEGKVALITGGGSGIGRASAIAFARAGARVVVADSSISGGKETIRLIQEDHGQALFVQTDVSSSIQVAAMLEAAREAYGRVDCAFNAAAVEQREWAPVAECTEEEWDSIMQVNLKGLWLCMKYEILDMLEKDGGSIVNAASVAGMIAATYDPVYGASKSGVISLTKSAARAYGRSGVRVNAICPALVNTPMLDRVVQRHPDIEANVIPNVPLGRTGAPAEVASAVLWLCSNAASYVTGHALLVDGGLLA